mmetsp:Transcript_10449/g.25954  ORF Transcript_10449/g.25954 Transcript_10449/m.25954 type:complete len:232 (+) Transcript_10449:2107-2802(+)
MAGRGCTGVITLYSGARPAVWVPASPALVHQPVQVPPLLRPHRDLAAPLRHLRVVQRRVHGRLLVVARGQHLGKGPDHGAVAPRLVGRAGVARRRAGGHVHQVVNGARALQQLPVQRAGGCVERARVHQQLAAARRVDLRQLGEADVVADAQAQPARLRVHHGGAVTRRERVGLAERDLARDVNVKQVHLAVLGQQLPRRVKHAARVVQLGSHALRQRPAYQRHARVTRGL